MTKYDKLIIAGGELKGFIMLGALQSFYDTHENITINKFVGTSIGSIICYLLAIGYTPIEIVIEVCTSKFLEKFKDFDFMSLSNCQGAYDWGIIHEFLEKLTIKKIGKLINIEELYSEYNKHITFVTTNYTQQHTEYISVDNHPKIPCLTAIRMSCNIPLFFQNFKYFDSYYIDGALSNNFPINMINDDDKGVLSIFCKTEQNQDPTELGIINYLYSLLLVSIRYNERNNVNTYEKKDNLDIVEIDCTNYNSNFFYMKNQEILNIFSYGYQAFRKIKEDK